MGQTNYLENDSAVIRHAYIKNGDVINQLQVIGENQTKVPSGGPNAFLAEFLFNAGRQPLLLISNNLRNMHYSVGNIDAWVFLGRTNFLHPYGGTALVCAIAFCKILFRLFKFKPDRILCGTLGFSFWACFIYARVFSIPVVHSLHNRLDNINLPWYKLPATELDKFILRRVGRVICHGPFLKQQLLDIGVQRTAITEFDCGFRDMWEQLETLHEIDYLSEQKYKTVTFLGRMEYSKGILDLFMACAGRLAADKELRLVYIGDGPDLLELKKKVQSLSLEKQVLFMGLLSHDKLAGIIHKSYVIVTPTRSNFPEGRCMATMEGLAMNVPVIAPDFGPFPYLVQHGVNGLLFRPDSIEDLQNTLNAILDDADLYTRLRNGAHETSKKLLEPPVTFYRAVQWAFRNHAEV